LCYLCAQICFVPRDGENGEQNPVPREDGESAAGAAAAAAVVCGGGCSRRGRQQLPAGAGAAGGAARIVAARPGEQAAGTSAAAGAAPCRRRRRRRSRRPAAPARRRFEQGVGGAPLPAGRVVRAHAAAAAFVGARPSTPAATPPLRRPRPHAQPRRPLQVHAQLRVAKVIFSIILFTFIK
jgi:hypothetical protein